MQPTEALSLRELQRGAHDEAEAPRIRGRASRLTALWRAVAANERKRTTPHRSCTLARVRFVPTNAPRWRESLRTCVEVRVETNRTETLFWRAWSFVEPNGHIVWKAAETEVTTSRKRASSWIAEIGAPNPLLRPIT